MKKKIIALSLFLAAGALFAAEKAVLFQFRQRKGDSVMHTSTVDEEVYINGLLNNRTQFINRTTTTIKDILKNGDAQLFTAYMTTQNSTLNGSDRLLTWGTEDSVSIKRKKTGELYEPDNPFLPTVMNIPTFSEKKVRRGETWTAQGKEVHDCRELFNMSDAISIDFTAEFTYTGDETMDGKSLSVIEVSYKLFQEAEPQLVYSGATYAGTEGSATQKIYWDNRRGDIDHYTEDFTITMYDIYGNSFLFHGTAHGEVNDYKSVNDDENVRKLEKSVKKEKLDNVSVKKGEKGLTISLDAIQFEPDSNILREVEKEKLRKIAGLLEQFSNDLLITGHTAQRGTVRNQQKLSEERAEAVAAYLRELGVRDDYHIFTQGKGAQEPVASNDTEEGRVKNRRVEITIMD